MEVRRKLVVDFPFMLAYNFGVVVAVFGSRQLIAEFKSGCSLEVAHHFDLLLVLMDLKDHVVFFSSFLSGYCLAFCLLHNAIILAFRFFLLLLLSSMLLGLSLFELLQFFLSLFRLESFKLLL